MVTSCSGEYRGFPVSGSTAFGFKIIVGFGLFAVDLRTQTGVGGVGVVRGG